MLIDIAGVGSTISLACIGAAWVVTEAARQMGEDQAEAIRRAGISHKVAACSMGLGEPRLSDQLHAKEPLNIFRWANLLAEYPRLELVWLTIRAERHGAYVIQQPELVPMIRFNTALHRLLRRRTRGAASRSTSASLSA